MDNKTTKKRQSVCHQKGFCGLKNKIFHQILCLFNIILNLRQPAVRPRVRLLDAGCHGARWLVKVGGRASVKKKTLHKTTTTTLHWGVGISGLLWGGNCGYWTPLSSHCWGGWFLWCHNRSRKRDWDRTPLFHRRDAARTFAGDALSHALHVVYSCVLFLSVRDKVWVLGQRSQTPLY